MRNEKKGVRAHRPLRDTREAIPINGEINTNRLLLFFNHARAHGHFHVLKLKTRAIYIYLFLFKTLFSTYKYAEIKSLKP